LLPGGALPESIPIQTILVTYVALLFSLSVHECAHAASAYWLEDDTAKRMGRMTLNPLVHIDILGTLILPLFGMISGVRVIGWAKPVPVDPRNLSRRFSQRTGMALVGGAGPASNVLLSFICILALAAAIRILESAAQTPFSAYFRTELFMKAIFWPVENFVGQCSEIFSDIPNYGNAAFFLFALLGKMIIINIGLAIFNLLPFGPLDGASILRAFLPWNLVPAFDRVQPALSIIILVLFIMGFIGYILNPLFQIAIQFYIAPLAKALL
jgi:Zn-dependent protease